MSESMILKRWTIAGIIPILFAAWFSVGHHHPDEHFQILEFCNYKLGNVSASSLPWEFQAKCRTAILPFIAYCVIKSFAFIGIRSPFVFAFLLRVSCGILSWVALTKFVGTFVSEFKEYKTKLLFVSCSFFLWYVPYLSVRFSSENMASILFMFVIVNFLNLKASSKSRNQYLVLLNGALMGFLLFIRLQMAFAFVGLAIWLVFIYKLNLKLWILLLFSGMLGIFFSVLIDYWFYNEWIITPLNYYQVNIIQHMSEKWGVFPWWYYFSQFFQKAVPPISIVLILFFFKGVLRKPGHVLSIIILAFLLGHFGVGHKEMRFLYPLSFAFTFLVCAGLEDFYIKYKDNRIFKITFKILIVINSFLLLYRTFSPAEEAVCYYQFLYGYSQKHNITLLYSGDSPYKLSNCNVSFYKPDNMVLQHWEKDSVLDRNIQTNKSNNEILYFSKEINPKIDTKGIKLTKLYCLLPGWILKFDFNNWQDRSNIWVVYRVE